LLAGDAETAFREGPSDRDGLGTTYHESGTLWMGDDPKNSVTDPNGKFHHLKNAYCVDQSLFPATGSVNPTLTGLTLTRKIAEHIATP
jgi:choline dehydrogenase-like flavoprotein